MRGKDYFFQIPKSVSIIYDLVTDGHTDVAQELALNTLLYAMEKEPISFSEVMTGYVFTQIKNDIENLRKYREEKKGLYKERAKDAAVARWSKCKAKVEAVEVSNIEKKTQITTEAAKDENKSKEITNNKSNKSTSEIIIENPQITPHTTYTIDNNLCDVIEQEEKRWVEAFCINRNVKTDVMKQNLKAFISHLQSQGVFKKEKGDFKKHFVSWLDTQNKYGRCEENRNKRRGMEVVAKCAEDFGNF